MLMKLIMLMKPDNECTVKILKPGRVRGCPGTNADGSCRRFDIYMKCATAYIQYTGLPRGLPGEGQTDQGRGVPARTGRAKKSFRERIQRSTIMIKKMINKILFLSLIAACFIMMMPPVAAQTVNGQTVIYQTSFDSDPQWVTNNPSNDYWDPSEAMYHFSLEPSTGNYAYIPVSYDRGSFTLEYDVTITRIDEGTTFRLGFSGSEMDRTKGPNVLTEFTNAKYGQIMWLRLITPSAKLVQANSQHAATELEPGAYEGPTAKYELNKTYHVVVTYEDDSELLSIKVTEKASGAAIWSYFVASGENLHGMNRIYIGTGGDYGVMGTYAQGFIDNVRLTAPAAVTATPTVTMPVQTAPSLLTTRPTALPTISVPTPYPSTPKQSPSPVFLVFGALGIALAVTCMSGMRKKP